MAEVFARHSCPESAYRPIRNVGSKSKVNQSKLVFALFMIGQTHLSDTQWLRSMVKGSTIVINFGLVCTDFRNFQFREKLYLPLTLKVLNF